MNCLFGGRGNIAAALLPTSALLALAAAGLELRLRLRNLDLTFNAHVRDADFVDRVASRREKHIAGDCHRCYARTAESLLPAAELSARESLALLATGAPRKSLPGRETLSRAALCRSGILSQGRTTR